MTLCNSLVLLGGLSYFDLEAALSVAYLFVSLVVSVSSEAYIREND